MPTFAAVTVIEQKRGGWRNSRQAADWLRSLERHVFPGIGSRPVSDVNSADVLAVLTPLCPQATTGSPIAGSRPGRAKSSGRSSTLTVVDGSPVPGGRSGPARHRGVVQDAREEQRLAIAPTRPAGSSGEARPLAGSPLMFGLPTRAAEPTPRPGVRRAGRGRARQRPARAGRGPGRPSDGRAEPGPSVCGCRCRPEVRELERGTDMASCDVGERAPAHLDAS